MFVCGLYDENCELKNKNLRNLTGTIIMDLFFISLITNKFSIECMDISAM